MPLSRINNPFLSSSGSNNTSITSPAANTIAFSTATTERMRIRSDGNTFIGVASATWDERVGIRPVTGTGQVGLGVYSPSNTYASTLIRVQSENATGTAWNLFEGRGQGGGVKILIDGNGLLDLQNGQIKFPASQNASSNANTLDDYEEGTWTPTCTNGTAGTAYYTKIGRMLYIYGDITFTISSGTTASITGLPFTGTGIQTAVSISYQNISANPIGGVLVYSVPRLDIYDLKTNTIAFGNGARLIFNCAYQV